MEISSALSVGTVVKLKDAEKRVIIMGILQQVEDSGETKMFDYIGVPYPEGFMGPDSTVLFQQTDIDLIFAVGYSDIERQDFIAAVAEKMEQKEANLNSENPEKFE